VAIIMPFTMPPQQQKDDDSSEHAKQNGCGGDGVTAAGGVVSEEERCEPAATTAEHDNSNDDDGPSSITTSDAKPLDADEVTAMNDSPPLVTADDQSNAPAENGAELISNNHPVTHVEPNNINSNDDGEALDNAYAFMQYQQQEQSVSSDSLVQLDEKLKQPFLTEIDDVEGAAAGASSSLNEVNNEAETSKEDAESPTDAAAAAATKEEGNEYDKTDEQKIDDDKNEKSTTENVHVGTDEESSTQSSQKSNTNDKDDTSSNETTTAPFISPDRATMSMSPSLLMNNNNNRGEELTPSPPSLLQQQQQQQHDQSPPLHHQQQQGNNNINIISSPSRITYASPPGRRTIKLRLLEEIPSSLPPPNKPTTTPTSSSNRKTPFKSFRQIGRIRSLSLTGSLTFPYLNEDKSTTAESESGSTTLHHDPNGNSRNNNTMLVMDRGTITVSWYDGTTSSEMQEHVFGCVLRKLNQSGGSSGGGVKLEDVRLLDENVEPHEEVVLCPFLPDGSQFLLRFRTVEDKPERTLSGTHNNNAIHHHYQQHHRHPFASRAPDSPSAEPSPHPSNANLVSLGGMNSLHPQQLQVLNAAAAALLRPPPLNLNSAAAAAAAVASSSSTTHGAKKQQSVSPPPPPQVIPKDFSDATTESTAVPDAAAAAVAAVLNGTNPPNTTAEEQTDDLIEQQLRQLNELFLRRRAGVPGAQFPKSTSEGNNFAEEEQYHREEKKQVIFLIGNYLVLFMSLIALSAEIQSRLPQMMKWVQENYDSVQNCATDRDALVDCLSKGDFSGLVASFLLWATQSVAAKRVFLFGFDTPKKLWTVVYEALVSAVCWGISYLFIRRGLNPNTRQNFVHKYWKDAVYGSLAGFNAAFLKAVLKNLVPQDVALEALEGRQLRIFHWLGTLLADE